MGTITVRPKKPYTTDGMPLSSSIMGLNILQVRTEATSDIYMETDRPKGKAKMMANTVTHIVPKMRGTNPNWGAGVAVGNHSFPPSTSPTEISCPSSILPFFSFEA